MKTNEVLEALQNLGIETPETVSLYTRIDEDTQELVAAESEFGSCDLGSTEDFGSVVPCVGATEDGKLVEFRVAHALVHGKLGRMLGYF
jgi:hypothetical protein